ncbi:uncharacterized protein DNG_09707 [Cephalotrichum gorgonifer]|uniref:AB hydrolase-1 domain-containing protein n=1 Tax=Cephalotrichum gorgonifer TaxID=2041049 RepID=A0AAE8N838_9PEZI|nr:uncharacterized protein DNG_09707 [Cephalotrichum gorgonifer]
MGTISELGQYIRQTFGPAPSREKPADDPAAPAAEPTPSRYPLGTKSSDTFTLPDGRKLGYAQYGSPTGKPVLYMHGHPGSRIEAAGFHHLGLELGARIISVDRPGMGWSSPHPTRTILDFPKDLEHLTNYLGLEEYRVLGISGGGPYALACARAMPADKLKCVSIAVGLGPPDIGMKGANLINRVGFGWGYRYVTPTLARWFWSREPQGRTDISDEERVQLMLERGFRGNPSQKDLDFLKDEEYLRVASRSAREAFSQGFEGVALDGKLSALDFGFRVEDIRKDLPVQLWYGKQDTFVPPNHGVQIAARLGGRATLRLEDETHASLYTNCRAKILEELLRV